MTTRKIVSRSKKRGRTADQQASPVDDGKGDFWMLVRRHFESDALLDFRPEVAMGKALFHWYLQKADLDDTSSGVGRIPPALAALDRLEKVMTLGERALKIESGLGVITHADMNAHVDFVVDAFRRFVPPDKKAEAMEYLESRYTNSSLGAPEIAPRKLPR